MKPDNNKNLQYPHTGLILPTRARQANSFFHQPDMVKDWINKLPRTDPIECTKLLFKSLFEMNRISLEVNTRVKTLETFHNSIDSALINLRRYFISETFPLSDKNRKIALLSRELQKEMVLGYKTAITNYIDIAGKKKNDQNVHIISVHRAMSYLSHVLYQSNIIYETYPVNIWHELHLLFTYSSVNKIDRILISNEEIDNPKQSTIYQIYKRALLLSAASPYQLKQGDIEKLYQELNKLTDFVSLSLIKTEDINKHSGFLVNLNADLAPSHLSGLRENHANKILIFDTKRLLEKIESNLTSASEDKTINISNHLRQKLITSWGNSTKKTYIYKQLNFELNIALGLDDIHQLIELNRYKTTPKQLYLSKTESVTQNLNHDKESNTSIFRNHEVDAENKIGYLIKWPKAPFPGIKVDQLIGIQTNSTAVDFGLATVRWIKNVPDKGFMIGIEIISHSCKAIHIRPDHVWSKPDQDSYSPALSITHTPKNIRAIILQSGEFHLGEKIFVKDEGNQEHTVNLSKQIESSEMFSLYDID